MKPKPIRILNTLSGKVEELVPAEPPTLRMYACGPTVYSRAHIGNFRTFVMTDLLRRALRYNGWSVLEVMNITDVDDRIITLASQAGVGLREFTEAHIAAFREDLATLRLETPEVMPRATEHIEEMVEVISRLIANGHTYTAEGSVYFRIGSFPAYGRLSRLDVAGIQAGARVDTDKYDKENARDFVLWKLKSDEPAWAQWDAPFGKGRPGWHIECSAMSMKYLGESFDLHAGGVDLQFPHHENEIAQSECATGQVFARHWFHVEHLLIDSETMSKSKGNVFNIPELVARGFRPEAIRYLLASGHYRKQQNFTFEAMQQATSSLERVHGLVRRLGEVEREGPAGPEVVAACRQAEEAFGAALTEDLNTPEALAAVHGLVGLANGWLAAGELTRAGAEAVRGAIASMDAVFAVLLPAEESLSAEEQALLDARQQARRGRQFARADELRASLLARGIVLEDTPRGVRWHRQQRG